MKINPVINFASSTVLLASIALSGCFGQRIYVYEKIPEANECRRYTEYFQVSKCNRKHHFTMNKKLYRAIQTTNFKLKKKFNQKVKCTRKITGRYLQHAMRATCLHDLTFQHTAKLLTENQT